MALKYLVDLNLSGNEVQNFAVQTNAGEPTALAIGHLIFDTTANKIKVSPDGTGWAVVGTDYTADGTTLSLSAGNEFSIKDSGVGTTQIANLAVTNDKIAGSTIGLGKLANIANNTILGNVSGSAASPAALTKTQVLTFLNVADGAEVNVQADWNATTGDAFIQNKPTLGTLAALNSVNAATIDDNSVGAAELGVSGNGTAGQILASDGAGGFTWANDANDDVSRGNLEARLLELTNPTIGDGNGTITVSGNLTVTGTTTTVNTETINLADNIITLNSNFTGPGASENAGFEVERGDADNVALRWNEGTDRWEFTNDGTGYVNIPEPSEYTNNTGTVTSVAVTGSGGITVSSGSPITTSGTIALTINDDAIANAKLANDSITINGTAVALGGSINVGDITGVTAGDGLSGGGTSGAVTLHNDYIHLSVAAQPASPGVFNIDAAALGFQVTTAIVQVFDNDNGIMVMTDISWVDGTTLGVFLPDGSFKINIHALRA